MNRRIKRQKGGAEKKRAKSRKLLLADSEKCANTNVQDTEQTDQGQGVKEEDSEDSQSSCILKLESSSPMGLQKCVLFRACEVISVC